MNICYRSADVYTEQGVTRMDLGVVDGRVVFDPKGVSFDREIPADGLLIVPGFTDVHVHFREPGFSYKETIRSGSRAAAHGGYTAVCAMPNLRPAPSTVAALSEERALIARDACVRVYPYGTITMEQSGRGALSDMEALAPYVLAFSDDGKGVQEEGLMREAMKRAAALDLPVVAHCEDERELKPGGCIHDGDYARRNGHVGINSASEWKQVERDIRLCEETGCRYHVCHVSTKESVELIRDAKRRGVRVSCETGPHYLIYTDEDLQEDGSWKMNPPIRSAADRKALLEGVNDGTIDCLITDHAPHSAEEKAKGLDHSAFGIVGLETAFPVVYTMLVRTGKLSFERMIACLCENPRRLFRLPGAVVRAEGLRGKDPLPSGLLGPDAVYGTGICEGSVADLTVLDLEADYRIDSRNFFSMGKSTLFDGARVRGRVVGTLVGGIPVYPFTS